MKFYNEAYNKYILYKRSHSSVGSFAEFDATVAATRRSEDCGEAEHREWGGPVRGQSVERVLRIEDFRPAIT